MTDTTIDDTQKTTTVTIERPDSAALMRQADAMYSVAIDFEIDGPETYELAAGELRDIKARITRLDEQRKAITRPLDAAKRAVMDLFQPAIDRLTLAEGAIKKSILTYNDAQERKRKEEQARREAAARAERERLEAQAREQAAEAARLQAAAEAHLKAAKDAEERQKAEAMRQQAEAAAENAAAAQSIAETVVAPAVVVENEAPAGIGTRSTLDFKVANMQMFIRYVGEHPELVHLLRTDDVKLRAYVRALGPKAEIPGVEIIEKRSVTARKG